MKFFVSVVGAVALFAIVAIAQTPAQLPVEKPSQPAAKPAPRPAAPRGAGSGSGALTVQATDQSGNPVADVAVRVSGPVDRSGTTGRDGSVAFRSMRSGVYRLRFEHDAFITLEREVTTRAGGTEVSVALSAAPPKPEPVAPVAPPPPPAEKPAPRNVQPHAVSIPDYLDRNLIGSEPVRTSLLGCADGGTAVLLQVRDPLNDRRHADADELLYVVAGGGFLRMQNQETRMGPGHFALVPRGMMHSLRRDGRNPLIAVSILAGSPCTETGAPIR